MNNRPCLPPRESLRWSNRILIASLIGIIYLTFFPFRFDFTMHHFLHGSPFLLGSSLKNVGTLDFFLNILLFVPFGAGVAAKMKTRSVPRPAGLLAALAAGAITSYIVEFLQLYIPMRDSGWNDVLSNSIGSVAGFVFFEWCGETLLDPLSRLEAKLEHWLSVPRASVFLALYLGFFFALSIPLQKQTRLSNWDMAAPMVVGSDGTPQHAWKGQIAKLELWDHAISDESARELTSSENTLKKNSPLVSYEFTGAPPSSNYTQSLAPLNWVSSSQPPRESAPLELDGSSWLSSIVPVQDLTSAFKTTNQFSMRIVCTPADTPDLDQRTIFSISKSSGIANVTLRQDGPDLFFWIRNPLTEKRAGGSRRAREISARNVFAPGQKRDILVSYDGSDVSFYVNAIKEPRVYSFSPGAAFVPMLVHFKGSDLGGDLVLYDSLIFIPAGLLLGWITRGISLRKVAGLSVALLWFLLPSVFYEMILVWVSGRAIYFWQISLCLFLTLLGMLLMNADRSLVNP